MNALFNLGQAFLQVLDPERAHDLAILSLELGFYPRQAEPDDPRLKQSLFGLDFPNPIGMAAGFDKSARVASQLLDMGFGFVEVGTLTPKPQRGNPRPRIFRSMADGAIINRLGFNNDGQQLALSRLRKRGPGIVGINLGANKDSADRIEDYVQGLATLGPVASYVTVNISSPNTPGLRNLQSPEALESLLSRLNKKKKELELTLEKAPVLLVKLAPDIPNSDLPDVVNTILKHGMDGIIVANTTVSRESLRDSRFAAESGGLSGRPLFASATRMLAHVWKLTEGKVPLIGVGGIESGETALAKIEAGASLVQIYTGLVFKGPDLIGEIKQTLAATLTREKLDSIAPLVGRRAEAWAAKGMGA